MKTFRMMAMLGVAGLGLSLGLAGCAEDNDKASLEGVDGAKAGKMVTPPGTASSSADAAKAMQANNPMMQSKNYKK